MTKLSFAALGLIASLVAGPVLAQTPQTGTAPATRPAAPAATTTAPAAPAAQPAAKTPLVDINHASKEELDALPGIGAVRAEAIIKGRPYKGKDELLRKKVLPSNVYEGIKDRVVARQS
jgi:DNA uptake protein ComE-like DNA-binding protein